MLDPRGPKIKFFSLIQWDLQIKILWSAVSGWLSSRNFFQGGKLYCYANFYCHSIVFGPNFREGQKFSGGNCLRGTPPAPPRKKASQVIVNNKYVKPLSFTSIGPFDQQLKIRDTVLWLLLISNMLKFLVNLLQQKYIYGWNMMVYVHITFDVHWNSFIWIYKIHALMTFSFCHDFISNNKSENFRHDFISNNKSENFQSWSVFGREFCISNSDNQAPSDKRHETQKII